MTEELWKVSMRNTFRHLSILVTKQISQVVHKCFWLSDNYIHLNWYSKWVSIVTIYWKQFIILELHSWVETNAQDIFISWNKRL
jgi:hypothetical protein